MQFSNETQEGFRLRRNARLPNVLVNGHSIPQDLLMNGR
jgi:hypothetical protein